MSVVVEAQDSPTWGAPGSTPAIQNGDDVITGTEGRYIRITITLVGLHTVIDFYKLKIYLDPMAYYGALQETGSHGAVLTGGQGVASSGLGAMLQNFDNQISNLLSIRDLRQAEAYIGVAPDGATPIDYRQIYGGTIDTVTSGDIAAVSVGPNHILDKTFPRLKASDYGMESEEPLVVPFGVFDDEGFGRASSPVFQNEENYRRVKIRVTGVECVSGNSIKCLTDYYKFTWYISPGGGSDYFIVTDSEGTALESPCFEEQKYTANYTDGPDLFTLTASFNPTASKDYMEDGDYFIVHTFAGPRCPATLIEPDGKLVWAASGIPVSSIDIVAVNGHVQYGTRYTAKPSHRYQGKQIASITLDSSGLAAVSDPVIAPVGGQDDFHIRGVWSGTVSGTYTILVRVKAGGASYEISLDGNPYTGSHPMTSTWSGHSGLNGLYFWFGNNSGYTPGDIWTIDIAEIIEADITSVTWGGFGIKWRNEIATNPARIINTLMAFSRDDGHDVEDIISLSTVAECAHDWGGRGIEYCGMLPQKEMSYLDVCVEVAYLIGDIETTEGYIRILPIRRDIPDTSEAVEELHWRNLAGIPRLIPITVDQIQNDIKLSYGDGFHQGAAKSSIVRQNHQSRALYSERHGFKQSPQTPIELSYPASSNVAIVICENTLAVKSDPAPRMELEPIHAHHCRVQIGDTHLMVTSPGVPNPVARRNGVYKQPTRVVGRDVDASNMMIKLTVEITKFKNLPFQGDVPLPDIDEFIWDHLARFWDEHVWAV